MMYKNTKLIWLILIIAFVYLAIKFEPMEINCQEILARQYHGGMAGLFDYYRHYCILKTHQSV